MIDDRVRNAFDDADSAMPTGLLARLGADLAKEYDALPAPEATVVRRPRVRNRARVLAGIAIAVALVAAVGVFAGTRRDSDRHGVEVRPTASSTTTRPAISGPDAATTLADELLRRATLPPGARVSTAPPPPLLAQAATMPGVTTLVDHHRQYTVPSSAADVTDFVQSHANSGTVSDGVGTVTGPGNTVVYFVAQATKITGDLIVSAEIEYSVTAATATTSILRVDAIVVYGPRHPHIPARDVVVVVTRELASDPHRLTRIVVTDARPVARLVAAFESSKTDVGVRHCPAEFGNPDLYTLSFSQSRAARPDVVVSIAHTGCSDALVKVDGHAAPPLTGGLLLDAAQQLFTHS